MSVLMTEKSEGDGEIKDNNDDYNNDDGGEGGVLLVTTMPIW